MTQDIVEALGIKPSNSNDGNSTEGTRSKYCTSCGTQIHSSAEMCPHCGKMIGSNPVGTTQSISTKAAVEKYSMIFGIIASTLCFIAGICCFCGDYMGGLGPLPTAIGLYFIAKGFFLGPMIIVASRKK